MEIEKFKKELKDYDLSAEKFYELFPLGMEILGLSVREISTIFGVSKTTIYRWKSSKNAPHSLMRGMVILYFEAKIK